MPPRDKVSPERSVKATRSGAPVKGPPPKETAVGKKGHESGPAKPPDKPAPAPAPAPPHTDEEDALGDDEAPGADAGKAPPKGKAPKPPKAEPPPPKERKVLLLPTEQGGEAAVGEGDLCEALEAIKLTAEASGGGTAGELAPGATAEVTEVGDDNMLCVQAMGSKEQGWIRAVDARGRPVIAKCRADLTFQLLESFRAGEEYEVVHTMTVRATEALNSKVIDHLPQFTRIKLESIGTTSRRRGKVAVLSEAAAAGAEPETRGPPLSGWVSLTTRAGEALLQPIPPPEPEAPPASALGRCGRRIRDLLAAARAGDLEGLKEVLQPHTRCCGGFSVRPNLNSGDSYGRTALMYAAALGHKAVVEFLVHVGREVDINWTDVTSKNALHHAAKRARSLREMPSSVVQGDIVTMLLHAHAFIEAVDHHGNTPLMLAVAGGEDQVVRRLLMAQANPNAVDFCGLRPLDHARRAGQQDCAQMIERAGGLVGNGPEPAAALPAVEANDSVRPEPSRERERGAHKSSTLSYQSIATSLQDGDGGEVKGQKTEKSSRDRDGKRREDKDKGERSKRSEKETAHSDGRREAGRTRGDPDDTGRAARTEVPRSHRDEEDAAEVGASTRPREKDHRSKKPREKSDKVNAEKTDRPRREDKDRSNKKMADF